MPIKQGEALDLYYNQDCSLSEIAEHFSITRQGVRDCIKRGENTITQFEEKLGLMKKLKSIETQVEEIRNIANKYECDKALIKQIDKTIEEIYK